MIGIPWKLATWDEERPEKLAADSVFQSAGARTAAVDLSEAGSGAAVVELAVDSLGGLDVTVHCIGVNDRRPIGKFSEADWSRIVSINLSTGFRVAQAAESYMRNQKNGRIIFFSSVSGLLATQESWTLRGDEGRHQPAHACYGG